MHAAIKGVFLAILCAAAGVILCRGGVAPPLLAALQAPASPQNQEPNSQKRERQPDEVVKELLGCLEANQPGALWNALPTSYQNELAELVHEFAKRVPAEVWQGAMDVLRKGPALAKASENRIEELAAQGQQIDPAQLAAARLTAKVSRALFEAILAGNLADQQFVQSADLPEIGSPVGLEAFRSLRSIVQGLPADSPAAWPMNRRSVEVELVRVEGDQATVYCRFTHEPEGIQIPMVRVEGKWIPKYVADIRAIVPYLLQEVRSTEWNPASKRHACLTLLQMEYHANLMTALLSKGLIDDIEHVIDPTDSLRIDTEMRGMTQLPIWLFDQLVVTPPETRVP